MATAGAHRRGAVLIAVVLAGAPVGGCTGAEAGRDASAPPTGSPPAAAPAASAAPTPPQDLCARIVGHWARKALDEDTYGDYQSMGLSNAQYAILREVVDAARAEERRRGARAADALIEHRTRTECAELYRTGTPTREPWR